MKVFIISGPSGSGKSSLLKKLLERAKIKKNFLRVLTFTTRLPRKGEKEGEDYHFLTKDKFLRLKKKGYFLETKRYLEDFYGTPKNFLKEAESKDKHPLLCIDVEGAFKIKEKFKNKAVLIFIYPPSLEILKTRLKKRKTESGQILKKRLRIAKKEVKYAKKYQHQLVNKKLKETVDRLENILLEEIRTS